MTDKSKISLEDIATLSTELEASNKTIEDLRTANDQLEVKRGGIITQYIIENELFKDTEWTLKSSGSTLEYHGSDKKDPVIDMLKNMVGDVYSTLLTGDGIELYYSDESITASFDSHTLMPDFVRKFKIKIDGSEIVNRLKRMNKDTDPLIELCHFFNLKY